MRWISIIEQAMEHNDRDRPEIDRLHLEEHLRGTDLGAISLPSRSVVGEIGLALATRRSAETVALALSNVGLIAPLVLRLDSADGRTLLSDIARSDGGRALATSMAEHDLSLFLAALLEDEQCWQVLRDVTILGLGNDLGIRLACSEGGRRGVESLAETSAARLLIPGLSTTDTLADLTGDLAATAAGRDLAIILARERSGQGLLLDLAFAVGGKQGQWIPIARASEFVELENSISGEYLKWLLKERTRDRNFALALASGGAVGNAGNAFPVTDRHEAIAAVMILSAMGSLVAIQGSLAVVAAAVTVLGADIGAGMVDIPSTLARTDDRPYDVALSFAGENRAYVRRVARILQSSGIRVFYDGFESSALWGKDLYTHLADVYSSARLTVIFISEHYRAKRWARHELRAAQARAIKEATVTLLPARFDGTEIPGLHDTVGYVDLSIVGPQGLSDMILNKLSSLNDARAEHPDA